MTPIKQTLYVVASLAVGFAPLSSCSVPTSAPPQIWSRVFPQADTIEDVSVPHDDSPSVRLFVIKNSAETVGYLVEQQVRGRSGPFTILVLFDTELTVQYAAVPAYPYTRGRQVRSPTFTQQFVGKASHDPIRLGEDISAVSGATISSRAAADGVRHARQLIKEKLLSNNQP